MERIMARKIIILLFPILSLLLTGCKPDEAVLTGIITNSPSDVIILADETSMDTFQINTDGSFIVKYNIDRAGFKTFMIPKVRLYKNIWMENGKKTNLTLDAENVESLKIAGDSELEIEFEERMRKEILGWKPSNDSNFLSYQKDWDIFADSLAAESKRLQNSEFSEYVSDFLSDKKVNISCQYAEILRERNLSPDNDAEFTEFMRKIDINDESNLRNSRTFKYLVWESMVNGSQSNNDYYGMLKVLAQKVKNKSVADELGFRLIKLYFNSDNDKKYAEEVYNLSLSIVSDEMKKQVEDFYMNSLRSAGSITPDIKILDSEGRSTTLHQILPESVTYIDIWSTWCVPCCKEIPYIETLEKEYRNNKGISFISISIDTNLADWKKFIKKHNPAWPQYVIPEQEQDLFFKNYAINGIPRFIVLDKDKKIIDLHAPKPSSDTIRVYLDELTSL